MISKKVLVLTVVVSIVVASLFFLMPKTGSLSIETEPVEGDIHVDGELVGRGFAEVILPIGPHTVSFGNVSKYNPPKTRIVHLIEMDEMILGTYVKQTGVVAIETMTWLRMPGATAGFIAFHLGDLYINSTKVGEGQLLKEIETGTYLMEFGDMPGFEIPHPVTITVTNASSQTVTAIYKPLFENISVSMTNNFIESDPSLQIVDVRGSAEFNGKDGHLPGAINIPLRCWPEAAGNLEMNLYRLDKERPVLVYCASGMGSVLGAGLLHNEGFVVYHMDGGLIDWLQAGYPVVVEDGD